MRVSMYGLTYSLYHDESHGEIAVDIGLNVN